MIRIRLMYDLFYIYKDNTTMILKLFNNLSYSKEISVYSDLWILRCPGRAILAINIFKAHKIPMQCYKQWQGKWVGKISQANLISLHIL